MLSLWNPVTQAFESASGAQYSQTALLLNLLIEARVQTRVLFAIGADVMKDTTENAMRLDAANELPDFVTGPTITNNL